MSSSNAMFINFSSITNSDGTKTIVCGQVSIKTGELNAKIYKSELTGPIRLVLQQTHDIAFKQLFASAPNTVSEVSVFNQQRFEIIKYLVGRDTNQAIGTGFISCRDSPLLSQIALPHPAEPDMRTILVISSYGEFAGCITNEARFECLTHDFGLWSQQQNLKNVTLFISKELGDKIDACGFNLRDYFHEVNSDYPEEKLVPALVEMFGGKKIGGTIPDTQHLLVFSGSRPDIESAQYTPALGATRRGGRFVITTKGERTVVNFFGILAHAIDDVPTTVLNESTGQIFPIKPIFPSVCAGSDPDPAICSGAGSEPSPLAYPEITKELCDELFAAYKFSEVNKAHPTAGVAVIDLFQRNNQVEYHKYFVERPLENCYMKHRALTARCNQSSHEEHVAVQLLAHGIYLDSTLQTQFVAILQKTHPSRYVALNDYGQCDGRVQLPR